MYTLYLVTDEHDYLELIRAFQEFPSSKENCSLRIMRTDEIMDPPELKEIIMSETPNNDSLVVVIRPAVNSSLALANVYNINGFLGLFSFKSLKEILEKIKDVYQQCNKPVITK